MRSKKKTKHSLKWVWWFVIIVILIVVSSVLIFWARQPKILGTTVNANYTVESFNFGLYKTALYYPSGSTQFSPPYPVIVFHHGMMAKYDYYTWFAEAMVKKGYIVVLPNRLLLGVNLDAGANLTNYLLSYLSIRNRFSLSLRNKVDLTRVGVAGHSMGADVTLYGANLAPKSPINIRALLAIAPASKDTDAMKVVAGITRNMPLGKYIETTMNKLYNTIVTTQKPIMYLVGSLDGISTTKATQTLYEMTKSKKMLAIIKGANHVQFSPTGTVEGDRTEEQLDLKPTISSDEVFRLTILYGGAWFDYMVKGDQSAKLILEQGKSLYPNTFTNYSLAY